MNYSHTLVTLLVFPVIGGLIGWITNYIAVKMLFRPRKPVRILGLTFQGLVPKRQTQIAASIGETVDAQLIKFTDISAIIGGTDLHARLNQELGTTVNKFTEQLATQNPMFGMVLQGEVGVQVRNLLTTKLEESVPRFTELASASLKERLDFKKIVSDRIEQFDLSSLEAMIQRIASRELRTIEYLGGVLGFLIGLAQAAFVLWTQ